MLLSLVLQLFLLQGGSPPKTGDIQITCPPGLRVYVDDDFVGLSNNNEDGKYVRGLSVGRHTVRVERQGFNPASLFVSVEGGRAVEVTVRELTPAVEAKPGGQPVASTLNLQVGSLRVTCAPVRCSVDLLGKTYEIGEGGSTFVDFNNLPAGQVTVTARRAAGRLQYSVSIISGTRREIRADFLGNRVIDLTAEAERIAESERRAESEKRAKLESEAEVKRREMERQDAERKLERDRQEAQRRADLLLRPLIEFERIVPGSFVMGCLTCLSRGWGTPAHLVNLTKEFELGKFEITQSQWQTIMGNNPSRFVGEDLPVENVSWNDAQRFVQKLNARKDGYHYRLPTEAEWEYAARAALTDQQVADLDEMGWYDKNSGIKTHAVGQKQGNRWGLFDMQGNVWEWVEDGYQVYTDSPQTDPRLDGFSKVMRGGSYSNSADSARVYHRQYNEPDRRSSFLGFRLVREAATP